jgi:epoxyqueuosine reductase
MKEAIQIRARELGFDRCRITTADPPATAALFDQWLASGRHGEMGYLERQAPKRVDPQKLLPGVRSVITLAVSYAGPDPATRSSASDPAMPLTPAPSTPSEAGVRGVVARYARFADYHQVIAQRLEVLTSFIHQAAGPRTQSLYYVDTGPLLERDLAQRAGLGFIGKHTNLISRQLGNWFFLSEIITTLELEPDTPEFNRCGSCTRCLTACPTQAITAPFQLDARLCISYLTIELKGSIPLELRPAIGNRIFGCDDCLAVCPWNRFAREGSVMRHHARRDLPFPNLIELLAMDERGFKQRFAQTPVARAKRRGLLRNVCVALGNSGQLSVLPALDRAARDPEPLIAEHARWAIRQLQGGQISETLHED